MSPRLGFVITAYPSKTVVRVPVTIGKGTVVATAKLLSSRNAEPTDLKVLTLTIV